MAEKVITIDIPEMVMAASPADLIYRQMPPNIQAKKKRSEEAYNESVKEFLAANLVVKGNYFVTPQAGEKVLMSEGGRFDAGMAANRPKYLTFSIGKNATIGALTDTLQIEDAVPLIIAGNNGFDITKMAYDSKTGIFQLDTSKEEGISLTKGFMLHKPNNKLNQIELTPSPAFVDGTPANRVHIPAEGVHLKPRITLQQQNKLKNQGKAPEEQQATMVEKKTTEQGWADNIYITEDDERNANISLIGLLDEHFKGVELDKNLFKVEPTATKIKIKTKEGKEELKDFEIFEVTYNRKSIDPPLAIITNPNYARIDPDRPGYLQIARTYPPAGQIGNEELWISEGYDIKNSDNVTLLHTRRDHVKRKVFDKEVYFSEVAGLSSMYKILHSNQITEESAERRLTPEEKALKALLKEEEEREAKRAKEDAERAKKIEELKAQVKGLDNKGAQYTPDAGDILSPNLPPQAQGIAMDKKGFGPTQV